MRRSCSASGSSSSRSARRSSSMASASWRRWASGRLQHEVGDVARVHVAQAGRLGGDLAGGGEQAGHLVPVDDAVGPAPAQRRRRPRRTFADLPGRSSCPPVGRRATSWTVSSPTLAVDEVWLTSSSPGRDLNGLRSTSHERRRAPSLSSVGDAVGVDEDAPALAGGDEAEHVGRLVGPPGARTMSSNRPMATPSASSSGSRMTRNAQISSLPATAANATAGVCAALRPAPPSAERPPARRHGPADVAGQADGGGDVGRPSGPARRRARAGPRPGRRSG